MWRRNLVFLMALLLVAASAAVGLRPPKQLERLRTAELAPAAATPEFERTLAELNSQFAAHWQTLGLEPAPRADDLTIARRQSLALTGTIPSVEELRVFLAMPEATRQDWWLRRLQAERRSADYLAERFARSLVGTDGGPFLVYRRRRFVNWLSDRLHTNQPYDALVRELLMSSGIWTSHPAVNFVTATATENDPDPIRLAGRTSRALLGMRIDCLQCHDDMLGQVQLGEASHLREGTQRDFHQLAAFFSEVQLSLAGLRDREQPYEYQFLHSDKPEVVAPEPPFLREALPAQGNRRERLAAWVTDRDNRPFARAAVNRVWALLFGQPLVEPIDDIPLAGPYPPGLELLTDDFIEHGYDLRRLVQLIASSEVFSRDSRSPQPITPAHEQHFAAFPLTRLRPEQAAAALMQSCSLATLDSSSHIFVRTVRYLQRNDFVDRYGDMGEDEFTDRGGTIPQRLLMMNGELVGGRTGTNPLINAATHLAMFARPEQAIEAAYLGVLSRRPTADEEKHFLARFAGAKESRGEVCEDMYWALVNSAEFQWNH